MNEMMMGGEGSYVGSSGGLAAVVGAVAGAGTLAWAALSPGSQMFGSTLIAPARPDEFCLTYDDGPNPAATPQLLEVLEGAGVRATFFLIGRYVRQCPDLVRGIRAAGHLVGNHTMTHPWLAWQAERRIREEISGASAVLEDVLGEQVRYFRAPHGARRPVVLRVVREMGMVPVQWNAMGYDWRPIGASEIVANVMKGVGQNRRASRGSNILLHDGGHLRLGEARMETVRATKILVERLGGSKFVGVDAWG